MVYDATINPFMRAVDELSMHVAEWLNSEWLRTMSYAAAIVACVLSGRRELDTNGPARIHVWPRFWFAAAGVLSVLLVGRLTGIGSNAYAIGRREAIAGGWYWSERRRLQGAAILGLGTASVVGVVVVARLMGDRTRRYLTPLACLLGLVGFAATRIVSLHQIDAVLYRRPILGARIASLIELTLTTGLVVVAAYLTQHFDEDRHSLGQQHESSSVLSEQRSSS